MPLKILPLVGVLAAVAWAQSAPTARQLFYTADKKPDKVTPAKPKSPVALADKADKVAKAAPAKQAPTKVTNPPVAESSRPNANAIVYQPVAAGEDQVIAVPSLASSQPLALRYSLVQIGESEDDDDEVSTSKVFHDGDRVRLRVEANQAGHLYVVQRGSSGNWEPLFPALSINGGKNRIEARTPFDLPSATQAFTFNQQPGDERLFVILSRTPVNDVERLVYRLRDDKSASLDAGTPALIAQNVSVSNEVIERLRLNNSRDLVIETVGTRTKSGSQRKSNSAADPENAVYVATASGNTVVAEIKLIHTK